jgi:peptidoglycan/xylan/chitin deacetylase (PgdA/CDA1 family)
MVSDFEVPYILCGQSEGPRVIMRSMVRNAVYRLLYSITGSGQGIRVILLYHSIGIDGPHSVPLPLFEQQMKIVAKQFQIVCLRDLPSTITSVHADTNIACVTFDDGYRDNYNYAVPVLERLGIKATFFVTTGFLGKCFPTFAGNFPIMSVPELRELVRTEHEVGAHTVSHQKLTKLAPETARKEVVDSKQRLEDLLGSRVVSFAYPKGDHNQTIKELVSAVGLKLAVTIQEGLVHMMPDWLALPRISIHPSLGLVPFRAKLSPSIEKYQQFTKWISKNS